MSEDEMRGLETREVLRVELREAVAACIRAGFTPEEIDVVGQSGAARAEEEEGARARFAMGPGVSHPLQRAGELRALARSVERGEINALVFAYHATTQEGPIRTISFFDHDLVYGLAAAEECLDHLLERFGRAEEAS